MVYDRIVSQYEVEKALDDALKGAEGETGINWRNVSDYITGRDIKEDIESDDVYRELVSLTTNRIGLERLNIVQRASIRGIQTSLREERKRLREELGDRRRKIPGLVAKMITIPDKVLMSISQEVEDRKLYPNIGRKWREFDTSDAIKEYKKGNIEGACRIYS